MARNIKWKIPFTSDEGTSYCVNIYIDGTVGTPVVLSPALSPITTQENDSDDLFEPVRTQTGYIRMVDGTGEWKNVASLTGDDRYVQLVEVDDEDIVRWQGYITGQAFDAPWDSVAVRELPVHCILSALQGIAWPDNYTGYYTFAQLLSLMIQVTGADIENILLPKHLNDPSQFLGIKFCGMNFLGTEQYDDGTGIIVTDGTYYDVLAAMCKMFGLTAHVNGTTLFFTSYGHEEIDYFTFSLTDLRHFVDDGTEISVETAINTTIDLSSQPMYGTAGSSGMLPGYRRLTVESDINEVGDIELDTSLVKAATDTLTIQSDTSSDEYLYWKKMNISPLSPVTLFSESVEIKVTANSSPIQFDSFPASELASKHNYDWKEGIQLADGDTVGFELHTRFPISITNATVCVNADFIKAWCHQLKMSLQIGDKYYDYVDGWVEDDSAFFLPSVRNGSELPDGSNASIEDTKQLSQPYNGAKGYCILVDEEETLSGFLTLKILSSFSSAPSSSVIHDIMTSLSVTVVPKDDVVPISDDKRNRFVANLNNRFKDEWSVSNEFASYNNNKPGFGLLYNPDGSHLETYTFSHDDETADVRPERELLAAASNHFTERSKKVTFACQSANIDSSMTAYDDDGTTYAIVSTSHDWIKEVTTHKAIDI